MVFEPILERVVRTCRGALGAALWGADGVPIARVAGEDECADPLSEESGALGGEFSRVLVELQKASFAASAGPVAETWVRFEAFSLGFWSIDEDLVLAMALAPHGNLGQARYLIRRNLAELKSLV